MIKAYGGSLDITAPLCDKFQSFLESMERNVFKHDIQEIYDQLLIMKFNSNAVDSDDEMWFDASEHGFNVKIKSAADLQALLHSSPSRNISIPLSRTGSNSRNLHCSSRRASPNGNASSKACSNSSPNIFSRIVYEVSMAANPGIGLARGFIVSFFDWGQSFVRRKLYGSGNNPKKSSKDNNWCRITIFALITLSIIISRRFRKRLAY